MNGFEKPFRKKTDPKNRKDGKNESENAACDHKITSEKWKYSSSRKLGI